MKVDAQSHMLLLGFPLLLPYETESKQYIYSIISSNFHYYGYLFYIIIKVMNVFLLLPFKNKRMYAIICLEL